MLNLYKDERQKERKKHKLDNGCTKNLERDIGERVEIQNKINKYI